MAAKVYPESILAPLTLTFLTDDVEALVTRLRSAGADVIDEPRDESGGPDPTRLAHLRSPSGEVIEVKKPGVAHTGFLHE
jgi:predicted enzyme related to lactoylglutathione lyase